MAKTNPLVATTAIILAGGYGTRLKSAVSDRPKPLAEINGRPFLDYQIAHLARAGIRDVLLCVGYGAQMIVEKMGASCHGARLRYIRDWPLRGTGGALRQALPALEASTVLVLNGDSFSGADLRKLVEAHATRPNTQATMLLAWREDREAFGGVTLDDAGQIVAFREKQAGIGPGYVNAGAYVFSRSVLAGIPADRVVSLERDVLPAMVGKGLAGWVDEAAFLDIGTPENYFRAHSFLREDAAA
ncbi:MAG: nucleotidyltransferase family protein [Alphaproteobacteria bacterium]